MKDSEMSIVHVSGSISEEAHLPHQRECWETIFEHAQKDLAIATGRLVWILLRKHLAISAFVGSRGFLKSLCSALITAGSCGNACLTKLYLWKQAKFQSFRVGRPITKARYGTCKSCRSKLPSAKDAPPGQFLAHPC